MTRGSDSSVFPRMPGGSCLNLCLSIRVLANSSKRGHTMHLDPATFLAMFFLLAVLNGGLLILGWL
jgi:hypothetical protein